jgi:hypothetical protein
MLNFKNKTEREAFVKDYKNWTENGGETKLGLWKSIPELDLSFYRYEFTNGAILVVTEYKEYKTIYSNNLQTRKNDFITEHRFCLILPEGDTYADTSHTYGEIYHRTYTLSGCSMGTVVDYMTKNKFCL